MRKLSLLLLCASSLFAANKVTISDTTSFSVNGQPASGSLVIAWDSFAEPDGTQVLAASQVVPLVNGHFTTQLYPTDHASPLASSTAVPIRYRVAYNLTNGQVFNQFWVIYTTTATLNVQQVLVTETSSLQIPSVANLPPACTPGQMVWMNGTNYTCVSLNRWNPLQDASQAASTFLSDPGNTGILLRGPNPGNTGIAQSSDIIQALGYTPPNPVNNLSEFASNASGVRQNLGLGTIATYDADQFMPSGSVGTSIAPLVNGTVPVANLPNLSSFSGQIVMGQIATTGTSTPNAVLHADGSLSPVDYSQMVNVPSIPTAVSNLNNDLGFAKTSDLAKVAITNLYSDLSGTPSLGTISTHDSSEYLSANAPGTTVAQLVGGAVPIAQIPTIPATQVSGLGSASTQAASAFLPASILGKPNGVAQLDSNGLIPTNTLPTIDYGSLSGLPTIPASISQLRNDSNFVAQSALATVAVSGQYSDLQGLPSLNFDPLGAAATATAGSLKAASNLADLSNPVAAKTNLGLSTVASTGDFNDLINVPASQTYTLQPATSRSLGGMICGANLTCASDGTVNANVVASVAVATATVPGTVIPGAALSVRPNGTLDVNTALFDPAGAAANAVAGTLQQSNNLSDVPNVAEAVRNLGLSAIATSGNYSDLKNVPAFGSISTHSDTDYIATSQAGIAGGVAALDSNGLIPLTSLPSIPSFKITGLGSVATHNFAEFLSSSMIGANSGIAPLDASGLIPTSMIPSIPFTLITGKPIVPTALSQLTNDSGYLTAGSFSAVATTGSYNDLLNKPSLNFDPAGAAQAAVSGMLAAANNLSDIGNPATARTNLGLGTIATANTSAYLADIGNSGLVYRGTTSANTRPATTSDLVATLGYTPIDAATLGIANGVAKLDTNGTVPSSELPAIPFASITGMPTYVLSSAVGSTVAPLVNGSIPSSYIPGLSVATTAAPGIVQVGANLLVDANGVLSVDASKFAAAGAGSSANSYLQVANNLSDIANPSIAKVNLGLSPVATSGLYADLSGAPSFAAVARSGQYADLAGAPTIPTAVSQLANDAGYVSSLSVATSSVAGTVIPSTGLAVDASGHLSVNYGTSGTTAAAGNDPRITGAVQSSSLGATSGVATLDASGNLTASQIPNIPMGNVTGIGTAASHPATDFVTTSQIGAASGVPSLDTNSKVPLTQIPTIPYSQISGAPSSSNLAPATTSVLGGVIVGTGLQVDASGKVSVQFGTSTNQAVNGSLVGAVNGLATLDAGGKVKAAQLNAGVANGLATLDANGDLLLGEIPNSIPATAIHNGEVSNGTFAFLAGITSDVQGQFDDLSSSISGVLSAPTFTGNVVMSGQWDSLTFGNAKSTLTLQGPLTEAANNNLHSMVSNNLVYNHGTTNYSYGSNIGDFAAMMFQNSGKITFIGQSGLGTSGGTVTQAQVDGYAMMTLDTDGSMKLGTSTTVACNAANRGKMQFLYDTGNTNDHMQACILSGGAYVWHQIF